MNQTILINLKEAMTTRTKINEELMMKHAVFEKQNKDLLERQTEAAQIILDCKETLRGEALTEYSTSGLKKLEGGIGIRVTKLLAYDAAEALKWAKEKDLFLQLDKRAFEKVAKTGELNFVKIEENPTVTFPKEIVIEGTL